MASIASRPAFGFAVISNSSPASSAVRIRSDTSSQPGWRSCRVRAAQHLSDLFARASPRAAKDDHRGDRRKRDRYPARMPRAERSREVNSRGERRERRRRANPVVQRPHLHPLPRVLVGCRAAQSPQDQPFDRQRNEQADRGCDVNEDDSTKDVHQSPVIANAATCPDCVPRTSPESRRPRSRSPPSVPVPRVRPR